MKPIILCGEAQGVNEAAIGAGFVGASGVELLRQLDEAEIIRLTSTDHDYIRGFWTKTDPHLIDMVWRLHPEVHRLNVFNLHPPGNDITALCGPKAGAIPGYPALQRSAYVRPEYQSHLDALAYEINSLDPNLVIALGNTPLWALCGVTGISNLRGTTRLSTHTVADFKVLPTYHPAAVLRDVSLRPIVMFDLFKAKREAEFPEIRRTPREIWIEPNLEDIYAFCTTHINRDVLLSVDIETSGNAITCIGFAPSPGLGLVIPFTDSRRKGGSYWSNANDEREVWRCVRQILEDEQPAKLFQNGLYDIAFLRRSMGISVRGAAHDTMLLHHALQPEVLKSLGFLGSLYADEGAWKHEHKVSGTIKRDS